MPQFSDDLFLGSAQSYVGTNANNAFANPAPMDLGFGPMGRVYLYDVVPIVGTTASVLTAKTPTVATIYSNATLASGTGGTTKVTRTDGTIVTQLDYPRAVAVTTASGSPTNALVTISGYDYYGNVLTEIIQSGTVASTQTLGRKAFFQISSVAFSGATTVAVSVDTTNVLGLPCRVSDTSYVLSNKVSGSLALDTGALAVGFYANTTTYSTQVISAITTASPGVITVPYAPASGTIIQFTGTPPAPLVAGTNYWWTLVSGTTGKVSTSQANYLAGTFVNVSGTYTTNTASLVPQLASSSVTPDVRGTYTPSATLNGSLRLVLELGLTAIQVGPQSTTTGLLGLAQA